MSEEYKKIWLIVEPQMELIINFMEPFITLSLEMNDKKEYARLWNVRNTFV